MPRPRDIAGLCIAVTLSGIAAAYAWNEWVLPWWESGARYPPPDDEKPPQDGPPTMQADPVPAAPVSDPGQADPNRGSHSRSLPPLRTHSLPPPLPNGRAILSGSYIAMNPDAMTSSTSLHTLSTQDGTDEEGTSQSNMSDTDTEPFVDVLSPAPTHVVSRRRSLRNHDQFAASHISFSELGNLIAPENGTEH